MSTTGRAAPDEALDPYTGVGRPGSTADWSFPGDPDGDWVVVVDAWKVPPPPGAPGSAEPSRAPRRARNAPAGPATGGGAVITRAVAVAVSGDVRELDLGSGAGQIDALYRAIGSRDLDMPTVTPHLLLWVDDQGLVNGSPINPVAVALLSQLQRPPGRPVRGTVVFTGAADPTGQVTSLAPEWVQILRSHPPVNEST